MTHVLLRVKQRENYMAEKMRPCEDRDRDWGTLHKAMKAQGPRKLEEARRGSWRQQGPAHTFIADSWPPEL